MSTAKYIILILLITHSSCIEVTLPITLCDPSQLSITTTAITLHKQGGYYHFCRLYKYESNSGLITKVRYKNVILFTNLMPPMSHSNRVVYEMVGENFEVVVITLGSGSGLIEGGYYIIDNKVYDIWSLDAVVNDELKTFNEPFKNIVEDVIYSRIPDMRYMHSFTIESVTSGDLIIAQKAPLNMLPNITIDTIVCIVMNRILVGQVIESESEETLEVAEDEELRPLDYSLRKRN
ncbi:conserved hypothetical protein [Theileria orientalis strain Shintoku]|uniref:Uncharacterized protein n=1 Tax=Theileria orientalis strain Shintoku TaxID=869250 RepID=J4C8M0_THEOR|nr:conserved hypothetical protein [Theileria orientalis strain Shintoku]PVC50603.1 hypothetical protein MACL_00002128 [Theileria orientalis]BAM41023.1 conserved hypothetical protein [Theileria orientalis strain Shintoku]|eukprot:XP_009691324.1 conserved hypothetical protein [Theileria orientalis strain Shintoku]